MAIAVKIEIAPMVANIVDLNKHNTDNHIQVVHKKMSSIDAPYQYTSMIRKTKSKT